MKIKNKILIILAIIVASLFVCNTNSYASDAVVDGNNITVNGSTYTMPDWFFTKEYRLFFTTNGYLSGSYGSYRYGAFIVCSDTPLFVKSGNGVINVLTSSSEILCYRVAQSTYNQEQEFDFSSKSSNSTTCDLLYVNYEGNTGSYVCTEYYYYDYYSTHDIYDDNSNLVFAGDVGYVTSETPTIMNSSTTWDTGIFDYIVVYSNDFVGENWQDFYLLSYDYSTETEESLAIYPKKVIPIQNGTSSPYYTSTSEDYGYVFYIPTGELGLSFKNGNNYALKLAFKDTVYDYFYTYSFTVANLTDDEIMQDKQDVTNNLLEEQQEILKEQHETSKGIWGTIKEILSYLNPFSENFFAYKLVALIIDGLKSLFIPSDDFFETFFTEMKDWFSDRLGFLFYPFELVIDILNKILNVNFSEPVFNIPDINEPFTGQKLIGATTYNLNSLLSNSVLENIHNIYLVVVDAIIIFALVNLAKRKFEEVTSKWY